MKRSMGALGVAAALILLWAGPAQAQYPPAGPTLTAACGGSVSGENWQPNSDVSLTVASSSLGTAHTDSTGHFSSDVSLPNGSAVIVAHGSNAAGNAVTRSTQVSSPCEATGPEVTGPEIAGGQELAFTGTDFALGLVILFTLTAVGFVALVASRRKSRSGDGP